MAREPFPLRYDYAAGGRNRASKSLIRGICALLAARAEPASYPDEIVRHDWPDDRDAALIVKAAVSPATMTTSAWAGSLAATALADLIMSLGPASAGSQLLKRGLQLSFARSASIIVPSLVASASSVGFVGEGQPIGVRALSLDTSLTLAARKFATISIFTREIFTHSTPTIESLVSAVLTESLAIALDSTLLDTAAGDAVRPPGLRNGIAAVGTASTATPKSEAMYDDVESLIGAVAPIAGGNPIVFVVNPVQAAALRIRGRTFFPFEVFATAALAAGTVIAIATNAIASALDPEPTIETSAEATINELSSIVSALRLEIGALRAKRKPKPNAGT
jgi:Phage capsid family